jgi:hypothetical protein
MQVRQRRTPFPSPSCSGSVVISSREPRKVSPHLWNPEILAGRNPEILAG